MKISPLADLDEAQPHPRHQDRDMGKARHVSPVDHRKRRTLLPIKPVKISFEGVERVKLGTQNR